jgi:hypothetical protein
MRPLSRDPLIDPTAEVTASTLGAYTEVGARTKLLEVAAYTIVAGNPARPIRDRFAPPIAARLQALAWWDWPHERLRLALDDFRALPAEAFLDRYEAQPQLRLADAAAAG